VRIGKGRGGVFHEDMINHFRCVPRVTQTIPFFRISFPLGPDTARTRLTVEGRRDGDDLGAMRRGGDFEASSLYILVESHTWFDGLHEEKHERNWS